MTRTEQAPKPGMTYSCDHTTSVVCPTHKQGHAPRCGIESSGAGQDSDVQNEGTPISNSQKPAQAAWLPESGCPRWCTWSSMHQDSDAYEDRSHSGGGITMPLMADEPLTIDAQAGGELNLHLIQHYRETEPRVWIGRDQSNQGTHLSLAETADLMGHLATLLATAEDAQPRLSGHPIWCAGENCGVHGHWSADREAGPMLAGLTHENGQVVVSLLADGRCANNDRPLTLDEVEALAHELLKLVATARVTTDCL
ncbi:hypothetical protein SAMN04489712_1502 [Thermomonospora echinospora]|uniref:Uncharacterized protein n=1 Tax=Thermomonospora echinospora TaxID=1992 RepID=A0A1H6ECQ0_9ACTN|nr:hypothetical protein [Thermomonospora echinospora]SEG94674.1 hypothetical protein SAMN04489712_1502 [Thermomonospora echinospora]